MPSVRLSPGSVGHLPTRAPSRSDPVSPGGSDIVGGSRYEQIIWHYLLVPGRSVAYLAVYYHVNISTVDISRLASRNETETDVHFLESRVVAYSFAFHVPQRHQEIVINVQYYYLRRKF